MSENIPIGAIRASGKAGQKPSAPPPMDDLGNYPTMVDDQPSRLRMAERTLRSVTIAMAVSGMMNVAMVLLIIAILPLQKVVPYLVTFKDQSNQVVRIDPMQVEGQGYLFATEDNVRNYIVERHSIVANSTEMTARWGPRSKVAAQSADGAYAQFRANAESDLKQMLTQNFQRSIEINSANQIGQNLWQVNFTTTDAFAGSTVSPPGVVTADNAQVPPPITPASRQAWVATLRVDYQPKRITYDQRLLNPLGFTVIDYSVVRRN